jgi:hypothetical protein
MPSFYSLCQRIDMSQFASAMTAELYDEIGSVIYHTDTNANQMADPTTVRGANADLLAQARTVIDTLTTGSDAECQNIHNLAQGHNFSVRSFVNAVAPFVANSVIEIDDGQFTVRRMIDGAHLLAQISPIDLLLVYACITVSFETAISANGAKWASLNGASKHVNLQSFMKDLAGPNGTAWDVYLTLTVVRPVQSKLTDDALFAAPPGHPDSMVILPSMSDDNEQEAVKSSFGVLMVIKGLSTDTQETNANTAETAKMTFVGVCPLLPDPTQFGLVPGFMHRADGQRGTGTRAVRRSTDAGEHRDVTWTNLTESGDLFGDYVVYASARLSGFAPQDPMYLPYDAGRSDIPPNSIPFAPYGLNYQFRAATAGMVDPTLDGILLLQQDERNAVPLIAQGPYAVRDTLHPQLATVIGKGLEGRYLQNA